jgi:hypothetical protein
VAWWAHETTRQSFGSPCWAGEHHLRWAQTTYGSEDLWSSLWLRRIWPLRNNSGHSSSYWRHWTLAVAVVTLGECASCGRSRWAVSARVCCLIACTYLAATGHRPGFSWLAIGGIGPSWTVGTTSVHTRATLDDVYKDRRGPQRCHSTYTCTRHGCSGPTSDHWPKTWTLDSSSRATPPLLDLGQTNPHS